MEQRPIWKARKILHLNLNIDGMTCTGCEIRIENALKKLGGVVEVKASFSSSNVYIAYDANVIGSEQIIQKIEKLGYVVRNKPNADAVQISVTQLLGIGIVLFALYVVVNNTVGVNFMPEIDQSMGYGILFFVGLLTSLHCIGMCGGINISQSISNKVDNGDTGKFSNIKPSLLYNSGRVISYTIIGGMAGALGSVVSFSGPAKGIVAVVAGVLMVIMGLNMLNIFPWLRKLNTGISEIFSKITNGKIHKKIFGGKIHEVRSNSGKYGPFYVGLLNGLMPCGPLQSMQIYALGTGSFVTGALSMFMSSIGTVPLMFGFGAVSSMLSRKFSRNMMKVSAVLVIALGIVMANRGLALSGFSLPSLPFSVSNETQSGSIATVHNGIQIVTTRLSPGSYEPIIVQKGIPVKWIIRAQKGDINGCNNEIVIPKFNKSQKLEVGDNLIEFTPNETGTFVYCCWMGMIRSTITVVDDINNINPGEG